MQNIECWSWQINIKSNLLICNTPIFANITTRQMTQYIITFISIRQLLTNYGLYHLDRQTAIVLNK